MSNLLPWVLESLVWLGIFAVASLLTGPVRNRCRAQETKAAGAGACLAHLVGCLSRPLAVLFLTGLALAARGRVPAAVSGWVHLPASHVAAWVYFWVLVLLIVFVEGTALQIYRIRGRLFPVPELLRNILRAALVAVVFFAVLRFQLGIDIAPLLATSALLTAVIGFALQGVLGNLLAGMSLHLVRSVVPFDWVAIGDVEGEVVQTTWRETRLRTVAGHIMIIPNSTVASAVIHNMTRPTPLRRHRINVGASYSDAPGDVIETLLESARAVPEVLQDPPPSAYVTEYKDFGINYVLRFWTNRYYDRTGVEGDVMRTIWYQFKRRGIEIPFPMSDKLLNDFMEVVYHQRRMQPEETEVQRTLADLVRSDFVSKLLVDEKGSPVLKDADLADVARLVRRVRYTHGETVFRQGEPGETCYVVAWGRVHGKVEYRDTAQANEFDLGPGSLFGEMSLVTGLARQATITAPEEAELLEVSKKAFTRLLGLREDIPQVLSRLVAERAAQNAAALEKLKAMGTGVAETIKRESILARFLRMLGR
ncbi:MAG: mechanosensitive ion channel family protein [Verrucomicrobiota bacterium]